MPCRVRTPADGGVEGQKVAKVAPCREPAVSWDSNPHVPTARWQRHGGLLDNLFDLCRSLTRVLLKHERGDPGNVRSSEARPADERVVRPPVQSPGNGYCRTGR